MANKKLVFDVESVASIDDDTIDKTQFSKLLVDCFSTSKSAHNTFVTEETLKRTAQTILLKPFTFSIDKRFNDLSTHVPNQIAGGFVPHNSKIEFKQMNNGSLMMSVEVLIWKRYSQGLLDYFKRDGGHKGVSVEIEIYESREDKNSGLLELIDYSYQCITGLGDLIRPAISDAQAVLVFSQEFEDAKREFEIEYASKYDDLDFSIPSGVKKAAQNGLDLRKKYGRGGTSVGLATARYLVKNSVATPEKVRHIAKYFPRHANDNLSDKESNGWIAWNLWGADAGRRWSTALVKRMDELDEKRMSYFSHSENVSSFAEDESHREEEIDMAKKEKDEAIEEVEDKEEMAVSEEEQEKPEDQKPEEEMAADPAEEKPEEEKPEEEMSAEEPKEEEKPEEEEEFSFGFSVEVAMSLFAEDSEEEKKAKEEFAKGKDGDSKVMMSGMFAAMCRMSEMCKGMMSEMSALKEFKAEREDAEKKFSVDLTLKELSEKFAIPEETVTEMRDEGYKVEFSELENWKTSVKAKSVDFAVIGKKDGKEDVVRIGMVWNTTPRKAQDNLWVK